MNSMKKYLAIILLKSLLLASCADTSSNRSGAGSGLNYTPPVNPQLQPTGEYAQMKQQIIAHLLSLNENQECSVLENALSSFQSERDALNNTFSNPQSIHPQDQRDLLDLISYLNEHVIDHIREAIKSACQNEHDEYCDNNDCSAPELEYNMVIQQPYQEGSRITIQPSKLEENKKDYFECRFLDNVNHGSRITINHNTCVITIEDAQESDSGTYTVEAKNDWGETTAEVTIQVVPEPVAPTVEYGIDGVVTIILNDNINPWILPTTMETGDAHNNLRSCEYENISGSPGVIKNINGTNCHIELNVDVIPPNQASIYQFTITARNQSNEETSVNLEIQFQCPPSQQGGGGVPITCMDQ